jgi:probable rRNA maturation factor
MAIINFHFLEVSPNLKKRNNLKIFIQKLFKQELTQLITLNYIFCSDEYLLDINKNFLKHNTYTDIITFNLSANTNLVEGEIYISIPRVKENATIFNTTIPHELHRVIFHGALHLCGYKDKSKEDKTTMRMMEDKYLHKYFR